VKVLISMISRLQITIQYTIMSVIILITKDLRKPLYKLRKNNNPDEKRWIEITNKLAKKVQQNRLVLQDKY